MKTITTLFIALLSCSIWAQKITVNGTVTDESGPLVGVNVLVKNTRVGTQTDFDGKYSIQAEVGQTISFSYLGYIRVEKKVSSKSSVIDVVWRWTMQSLKK